MSTLSRDMVETTDMAANFDYITSRDFRESLLADYAELRKCAGAEAWKSVQVIAGSIIEALLVDYLNSSDSTTRSKKDALKYDLAEAIAVCKAENVLSQRTADLCSVIRSYRNLIHPGRMVRMGEQPPNKASAGIAVALVDLITEDLSKVLRATVGLTGEQIISKIQRDSNTLTILKHLLNEVSQEQRERLLLELIPEAHRQARDEPFEDELVGRLESAYRIILETQSDDVRTRVASQFIRILREEDGAEVVRYGDAFFRPSDVQFVPESHRPLVKDYLFSRVPNRHTEQSLRYVDGIAPHLTPADVVKWADPFIGTIVSATTKESTKEKVKLAFLGVGIETSGEVDAAIGKRLQAWIKHLHASGKNEAAEVVRQLEKDFPLVPF